MLGHAIDNDEAGVPEIECGWERDDRSAYACADRLEVRIASKRFRLDEDSEDSDQMAPVNAVMYYVHGCP